MNDARESPIHDAIVRLAALLARDSNGYLPRVGDRPVLSLPPGYLAALRSEPMYSRHYFGDNRPVVIAGVEVVPNVPR
jgi:hypothetical protein